MWQSLWLRLHCWLGWHAWESRGGSFGMGSVQVCTRCGKRDQ